LAESNGHKEVAELLRVNKAAVNAKADGGQTPSCLAQDYGHKEMAELLRQHSGHE
jgi:ankyrin repeat protein